MSRPEDIAAIEDARREQLLVDLRWLLTTATGRQLAYTLVYEMGRLNQPSWAGAIKDGDAAAQHTAYNEGIRAMGATLYAKLTEADPRAVLVMMGEQIAARQTDLERRTKLRVSAGAQTNDR